MCDCRGASLSNPPLILLDGDSIESAVKLEEGVKGTLIFVPQWWSAVQPRNKPCSNKANTQEEVAVPSLCSTLHLSQNLEVGTGLQGVR